MGKFEYGSQRSIQLIKYPFTFADTYASLSPQISWLVHANGEIWKHKDNDEMHPEFVAIIRQDHFQ